MIFRRKSGAFSAMPNWMRWGILAFFGVAILLRAGEAPPLPPGGAQPEDVVRSLPGVPQDFSFDPYRKALAPLSGTPAVTEILKGNGPLALCGQVLHINYAVRAPDAGEAEPPQTLAFRLGGDANVTPLFSRGVLGMRVGGRRGFAFDPSIAASVLGGAADARVASLEVELAGTEPDAAALLAETPSTLNLRLYDTRTGEGAPVICGERVALRVTFWGASGEKIAQEEVVARLGEALLPAGLEQGVIGMREGGARTIILPPAWQPSLRSAEQAENSLVQTDPALHKLALAGTETVVADVTLTRLPPAGQAQEPVAPEPLEEPEPNDTKNPE